MDEYDNQEAMRDEPPVEVINLHLCLQGFSAGLSRNVTDPIAVPSGIPSMTFGKIYYDCTDPEEEGISIMHARITQHEATIEQFLQQHDGLVKDFADIEDAANVGNTARVRAAMKSFLANYRNYIEFVHAFRSNPATGELFLDFPSGPVTGLSYGHMRITPFNPTQDYSGAVREAQLLEQLLQDIEPQQQIKFGELAPTSMPYSGSASWMDSSYRGRLELTRKMLERFIHGTHGEEAEDV